VSCLNWKVGWWISEADLNEIGRVSIGVFSLRVTNGPQQPPID